jgi:hypothetical protein
VWKIECSYLKLYFPTHFAAPPRSAIALPSPFLSYARAHIMSEHVPKVIIVKEVYACLASSVHTVYTLHLMCNHVR